MPQSFGSGRGVGMFPPTMPMYASTSQKLTPKLDPIKSNNDN
jgi:hypothetical protein